MEKKEEKREWRKALFALLRPAIRLIAKVFWGASTKVYRHIEGPYLVIANHTYIADAMLMGAAFCEPVHIVAASATLEKSAMGRLVRFLADPIPVDKTGMDLKGIKRMMREAKSGHSIGLFPEGNITTDGSPIPFDPAVAKLAKQLKLKVVLYRIEGGYLKKPKWAVHRRRGKVIGKVVDEISVEEVAESDVETLYERIKKGIAYDYAEAQRQAPTPYPARESAAGIERLLYYCPQCRKRASFTTKGDAFTCSTCQAKYRLNDLGFVEGAPFATVAEWNAWQTSLVSHEDATEVFAVEGKLVRIGQKGEEIRGFLTPSTDGVQMGEWRIPYEKLDGAVLHDSNNLLLTIEGDEYRFIPASTHENVLPLSIVLKKRSIKSDILHQ